MQLRLLNCRSIATALACLVSLSALGTDASGQELPVLQDVVVVRNVGEPTVATLDFVAWAAQGRFVISNGGSDNRFSRVSSARIWINDRLVARPSDFNQQVGTLTGTITLGGRNRVRVELRGAPGAAVEVEVFAELPADVDIVPLEAVRSLALQQVDAGDTLALLESNGFRLELAVATADGGGGMLIAAGVVNDQGRRGIYTTSPSLGLGIVPAAIFPDGDQILIFQRPGGMRIYPDASGEQLAAEDIASFLEGNDSPSAMEIRFSASDDTVCDAFGTVSNPTCSSAFLDKVVACSTISLPGLPACPLCVFEVGVCLESALAMPACLVVAEKASGLACTQCLAELALTAGCLLQDTPCDTGCQSACVPVASCTTFYCRPDIVAAGAECEPEGEAVCDVVTLPDGDFFIGERTGGCDAAGECVDGLVRRCAVPDCQSCRDEFGGCAPDPLLEGATCTTAAGDSGICSSGECDTGTFDPLNEFPGAFDAVWTLQLEWSDSRTDATCGTFQSSEITAQGTYTRFPLITRDARAGTSMVDASFSIISCHNGQQCDVNWSHNFNVESPGACMRLEFIRPTGSDSIWGIRLQQGGCCSVPGGTTCRTFTGCFTVEGFPINARFFVVDAPFDGSRVGQSTFTMGPCTTDSRVSGGGVGTRVESSTTCQSVDPNTGTVNERSLRVTVTRIQ